MRVLAGVEAKILDASGALDVPAGLDGIDLVLVADHRFPGVAGPRHPDEVRAAIADGVLFVTEALEQLCEATALALDRVDRRPLVAHLFSVLPKIGLDEAMVPEPLLAHLAKRIAHAAALVEVNEKWSCPSARTVTALARAGVSLVAGSDSHHCRDIGVYRSVRLTGDA
jgi:putative hydrolase